MKLQLSKLVDGKCYQKNALYRIDGKMTVRFEEDHIQTKETVDLLFDPNKNQYGIFAKEYRRPGINKNGCKSTDVLCCLVDERKLEIRTLIFDVKSNISAFGDDLSKGNAMLTVVKEVRDFLNQLHDELLHKDSFMLYYKDEGYSEQERVGIVTKRFEAHKFTQAASFLEDLFEKERLDISPLIQLTLKKNLTPYRCEAQRLRAFAQKKAMIGKKQYELHIFMLKQINDSEYYSSILVV